MSEKNWKTYYKGASCGDLLFVFRDFKPGELPLTWAAIRTEDDVKELRGSAVESNTGLLLSVQADRCSDAEQIFRPLAQREEELEGYRKCGCIFRGSGRASGNFYKVTPSGNGTVWVRNEGCTSLRFQTPDGRIYRVCASYTEDLRPENTRAQIGPTKVLLDLGGNTVDFCVSAVHVKYGEAPWRRGGLSLQVGTHVDTYAAGLFCGDDQLGVVEMHSSYFLQCPGLELLDIGGYGVSQWFVRNKGRIPLPLRRSGGETADIPPNGWVYALKTLFRSEKEACL